MSAAALIAQATADEIDAWITEARERRSTITALLAGGAMVRRGDGPGDNPFREDEPGLRRSWVTGYETAIAVLVDRPVQGSPSARSPSAGSPSAGSGAGPLGCHWAVPPRDR